MGTYCAVPYTSLVLVTTKRGVKGHRSISYRGYVGWQEPTRMPKTVNAIEFMTLRQEESANDGKVDIYTEEYIANYMENHKLDPDTYPITDWKKARATASPTTTTST